MRPCRLQHERTGAIWLVERVLPNHHGAQQIHRNARQSGTPGSLYQTCQRARQLQIPVRLWTDRMKLLMLHCSASNSVMTSAGSMRAGQCGGPTLQHNTQASSKSVLPCLSMVLSSNGRPGGAGLALTADH